MKPRKRAAKKRRNKTILLGHALPDFVDPQSLFIKSISSPRTIPLEDAQKGLKINGRTVTVNVLPLRKLS